MIPEDPVMLLSFVNLKLRDFYSDPEEMCEELEIDQEEMEAKLAGISYHYDKEKTSTFRGTRCRICTGCGRCAKGNTPTVVSAFCAPGADGSLASVEGIPVPPLYLVCADIGTTTIAMQLRRVADGAVEQTFTCVNPQRVYGADVLSRIQAAEDPVKKQ